MDTLQQHVLKLLEPQFNDHGKYSLRILASNITFLIKHTIVDDITARQVSITFTNIYGAKNRVVRHKAAVLVHKPSNELQVVVCQEVCKGAFIMEALDEKVDKVIEHILKSDTKGDPYKHLELGI